MPNLLDHLFRRLVLPETVLCLLLLLAMLLLFPGIEGGFKLDDPENLKALEHFDDDAPVASFLRISGEGIAGMHGRPVAMASFALQASSWPESPQDFLLVNSLLHLVAGFLVFVLGRRLFESMNVARSRAGWLALAMASLWLLQPVNVSTALYVVQRMALLAALFGFLAFYFFLDWREAVLARQGKSAIVPGVFMVVSLALAALSKENGLLLLPIMLVAGSLLPESGKGPAIASWCRRLLGVGTVCAVVGLFLSWNWLEAGFLTRHFSLLERLLTQPAVLLDYLYLLLVPSASAANLFHENYPIFAKGLSWWKWTAGVIVLVAMVVAAWRLRDRATLVSLGLLFFLIGHLMESTVIPLELYFEHRNYLPSFGLYLALVAGAARILESAGRDWRRPLAFGGMVYAVLLMTVALQTSHRIGHPVEQAMMAVQQNPTSMRARDHLGYILLSRGHVDAASRNYRKMATMDPGALAPMLLLANLHCLYPDEPLPTRSELLERAGAARFNLASIVLLRRILEYQQEGACGHVSSGLMSEVAQGLSANPAFATQRQELTRLAREFRELDAIPRKSTGGAR